MARHLNSSLCARVGGRFILAFTVSCVGLVILQYSAPAEAHGRRGGYFLGGAVLGAAIAGPRYYYPPPAYYYPPVRPYYPPPVAYVPAPFVAVPPQVVYAAPPPASYPQPPAIVAAPMSFEDRLVRLKNLCEQGLIPDDECRAKREQILREM